MNHDARADERHHDNIERLLALENGQQAIVERMDHLDECMDGVKANLAKWNRWVLAAFWMLMGMILASGSGTFSLQHLLEILKAVK